MLRPVILIGNKKHSLPATTCAFFIIPLASLFRLLFLISQHKNLVLFLAHLISSHLTTTSMWTRDSAVQMGLYNGRLYTTVKASPSSVSSSSSSSSIKTKTTTTHLPTAHETTRSTTPPTIRSRTYLRRILEGAIRRQAFNLLQDPYANAYSQHWHHPNDTTVWHDKDRVIGRGGWVETRNYELDSGAYFLTQVYDYYLIREPETTTSRHTDHEEEEEEEAELYYRSHQFFATSSSSYTLIYDAIMVLIETWIIEQYHDTQSNYRYFELPNQGKGKATTYTGMTWTGFRPR